MPHSTIFQLYRGGLIGGENRSTVYEGNESHNYHFHAHNFWISELNNLILDDIFIIVMLSVNFFCMIDWQIGSAPLHVD
jgi:hypothetical protein